jgi:hypothetical protein
VEITFLIVILLTIAGFGVAFVYGAQGRRRILSSEHSLWPRFQQYAQEREIILNNLKDLEVDQQMSKLNPEDYHAMRSELVAQAEEKTTKLLELEKTHPIFQTIRAELQSLSEKPE